MDSKAKPAIDDPRLNFVENADAFAREHEGGFCFRFLGWFTRATPEQLHRLAAKVYCDTLPNIYGEKEPILRSVLKCLTQPFYYLATKRLAVSRLAPVDYDVETITWDYFDTWQREYYDALPGTKRLTPTSVRGDYRGRAAVEPLQEFVTLRTWAALALAPAALPGLLWLSHRYAQNFLVGFRKALSIYAVNEGHFRRYPCRHFFSYEDMHNYPSRYLAFRQNCPGKFFVLQNGERNYHPSYAFGMADVYLTAGEYGRRLFPELRVDMAEIVPVGSLYLNGRFGVLKDLLAAPPETAFDLVFVDQKVWPYVGLDEKTSRSFERMFSNVNELKKRHPRLRIAYQLRPYPPAEARIKQDVLAALRRFFTEPIELLENTGAGESYRNVAKARVTMTFNSALAHEACLLNERAKPLFVNYADNPFEIYSEDGRFQLYDPDADYGRFESAVLSLLDLRQDGLPQSTRLRYAYFDGRVSARILAELTRASAS